MKNLLKENMHRFGTKNLNEQVKYEDVDDNKYRILLTVDKGHILYAPGEELYKKYKTPLSKQEAQEVMKYLNDSGYLYSQDLLNKGFEIITYLERRPNYNAESLLAQLKAKYGEVPNKK